MNLPEGYFLQEKKYRLTRTIGQGGFGITYLGVWNTEVKGELGAMKTKIPICIKEYFFKDYCYREKNSQAVRVHSITGEKLFGRFKEKLIAEANILSAVHHPNIVNVLEVFEANNTAYIIMEYIKGCSLKHLLDTGGVLPEYKVIKYTHQIGNALNFVHEKNIVHLDIKPGNILIDQNDNARLIDFGVSKRYDIEEQETSTTTLTLSKGFAAIEQYDDEGMLNFSPAPDIYSLGATMYNLLTGVVPVESILRASKQMLPPSSYNTTLTSKTEKAIMKAMEIKPENRYRFVYELLAAIDPPIYSFTENELEEPNMADEDDQTEEAPAAPSESEDDQTIIKSPPVITSESKKTPKRRSVFRRVTMVASILLIAVICFAIYSLFADTGGRNIDPDGMNRTPGDTAKMMDGPTDSTDLGTLEIADSETETETNEQSVQNNLVRQPDNNPVRQPDNNRVRQPDNNPSPQTTPVNTVTDGQTSPAALTPAQKAKEEKQCKDLIEDGLTKMSMGGLKGALDDFVNASDIAKKIDGDLTEINRLIDECRSKISEQEKQERLAQYTTIGSFGDLTYVRHIEKKLYGAIDASGTEIIPCEYIISSELPNGNREFRKANGSIDIWNTNGKKVQHDLSPN